MPESRTNPRDQFHAFLRLCKPGIVRMVGVTAAFSFLLALPSGAEVPLGRLLAALVGIMASAAGSAALNNVLERDLDARMHRTRGRELPRGTVKPEHALALGLLLTLGGVVWLALTVNLLTAFLVLLTAFLYVVVYTPLKTRTWLNTTIGAIPGALPTLCGWAAASNELSFVGWVMFAVLFAWQHPHFYAIAWLYRDDYERAGFKMLSVVDRDGTRLFLQVLLYALFLAAVSILPTLAGRTGFLYLCGAVMLAVFLTAASVHFVREHTHSAARKLLFATILYLPALLGVIMADLGLQRLLAA